MHPKCVISLGPKRSHYPSRGYSAKVVLRLPHKSAAQVPEKVRSRKPVVDQGQPSLQDRDDVGHALPLDPEPPDPGAPPWQQILLGSIAELTDGPTEESALDIFGSWLGLWKRKTCRY